MLLPSQGDAQIGGGTEGSVVNQHRFKRGSLKRKGQAIKVYRLIMQLVIVCIRDNTSMKHQHFLSFYFITESITSRELKKLLISTKLSDFKENCHHPKINLS